MQPVECVNGILLDGVARSRMSRNNAIKNLLSTLMNRTQSAPGERAVQNPVPV